MLRSVAALVAASLLLSCAEAGGGYAGARPQASGSSAAQDPAPRGGAPAERAPAPAASSSAAPAAASASAGAEGPPPDAGAAPAAPLVRDNKVEPPRDSEELQARARGLFEAVVHDDPARAEPFWFPKEPFIPLKDVKDPGKYWDQLHAVYEKDVRALHRKRKSWDGARFVRFEPGTTPRWVPPGDEANKIGYYRSWRGKLRYAIGDAESALDVHTVISWQGRWYITHLQRMKR